MQQIESKSLQRIGNRLQIAECCSHIMLVLEIVPVVIFAQAIGLKRLG